MALVIAHYDGGPSDGLPLIVNTAAIAYVVGDATGCTLFFQSMPVASTEIHIKQNLAAIANWGALIPPKPFPV